MAAIAFLRCERYVEWVRSVRSRPRKTPFSSSSDDFSWALARRLEECEIGIRLALAPYDEAGLDVQVNVFIGGGIRRWRCTVPTAAYLPDMPPATLIETGTVALLATIEGDPKIDLLALFLAQRDTMGARNRIWHLRQCFRDGLPPQLQEALTYGRTGSFED